MKPQKQLPLLALLLVVTFLLQPATAFAQTSTYPRSAQYERARKSNFCYETRQRFF